VSDGTITVNVMGTFSEKQRPQNGLDRIADYMIENRLAHVPIVAEIGFHKNSESLTGHTLTVKLLAVETGFSPDGSDPSGWGRRMRELLDEIRKGAGKGAVEETLFSVAREAFDFDGPASSDGLPGQDEIPGVDGGGEAETRLGPDGEHQVPPPSGEEILAERAEAAATATPDADEPSAAPPEAAAEPRRKRARPATADPFTPDGGDAA
jgi:hypothetical protein